MSDIHEIKIGFIGFGNMAQAMAAGLLRGGQTPAEQIFACARIGINSAATPSSLG